jgi:sterol desaturase/sphingolipid hydroxylase (fatty acid hydroxylase superfamily)
MAQMETTAYYAFGVPLYLGLMAVEARRAKQRAMPTASVAPSIGNLSAGLGSIVVGLFLGPALVLLYDWGLSHLALVHWQQGAWAPWLLAVVLADFGHYCHHRLDHRVAACWAVHGVHHQPEEMNFTVAMRHAWFSDLYSFPFYVPLVLLGVPTSHFFVATTLLSFHALITHTEQFDFPSFGFLVTPSSHVLHHAHNPRYLNKNFGAMLCVWDRLFGTAIVREPSDPPIYGTVHGYETHDGAKSQWVLWKDLFGVARQARSGRDLLRVLFSTPGWVPDGAVDPRPAPPPDSATLPTGTKAYVVAQFFATLTFSLFVFIPRESYSSAFKLITGAAILVTLGSLGGLLDARPSAWRWEWLRLGLCLVGLGVLLAGWSPHR